MKSVVVALLALCCMVGMALGQYGYGLGGGSGAPAVGQGAVLWLIGLLVIIFFLFGNRSTGATGSTTLVYGNFSATG